MLDSVVIDDFDFMGSVRFPAEADAPLVIDADGVLTFPVALQRFKAISGRDGEVVECGDGVNLGEFPQGDALDVRWERPAFPFVEQEGGLPASEGANHQVNAIVTCGVKLSRWSFKPRVSRRTGSYFLPDGFAFFAVGAPEFVVELEVHPPAGGDAEEGAQAQVALGNTAAFALFQLGEVGRGNAAAAGDLRLGEAGFLQRFAVSHGEEVEQRKGEKMGLRVCGEAGGLEYREWCQTVGRDARG